MFLPVITFALILTIPFIVSVILIRMCRIDETLTKSRVPVSYWGRYAGASESHGPSSIALHDPTLDATAQTRMPPHAVPWHP